MTDGGSGTITSSQQKYSASSFTYSSGGTALSGSPTQVNLTLPQRTDDTVGDWYDPNYGYCREFTMTAGGNSGGVATTTTAGFALVATSTISSLATVANGGRIEQTTTSSGTTTPIDVVFTNGTDCNTDGGDTVLDYYFEKYVPATGEFVAWVEPTSISSTTAESVLMYYGNSGGSDLSDEAGVFSSSGEAAVWNFQEDPGSAGAGGILDSTANNHDGTDNGSMTIANQVRGMIDGAFDFESGSSQYVNFGTVDLPGALSICLWTKLESIPSSNQFDLVANFDATTDDAQYEFILENDGVDTFLSLYWGNSGSFEAYGGQVTPSTGQWYHYCAARVSDSQVTVYENGTALAPGGFGDVAIPTTGFGNTAVARPGDVNAAYTDGVIDDVRMYSRALHSMDIKTIYNNTKSSSVFWTFGTEETPTGGGGTITDDLLWGLGVPNGTPNGSYTGTNTFTAAAGI
jgi:hypothetical protein